MKSQKGATLKLHHLNATLDGVPRLLDATAHFYPGSAHAVVGRSGAGKSVLLKCGLGLLPLSSGETEFFDAENGAQHSFSVSAGDDEGFRKLRQKAVLVLQDPALLDDLNVVENLDFVLSRVGNTRTSNRETPSKAPAVVKKERLHHIHHWLDRMGLTDIAHRLPAEISPGMQRRVALTRALCLSPSVLIADEPTTGLDPKAARSVDKALLQLTEEGVTLIVVTHDLRSIQMLQPRLTWVHEKTVAYSGRFDDDWPPELRKILQL